jgi:prepilin-type N-terminal cleavage/methylation domain-containing protein
VDKKNFSRSGFTLIELMVVITIIALMFGVVISSANFLRSASGDAKRKADLAEIQSALQNYYADQNYFPHAGTNGFKTSGSSISPNLTSEIGIASPAPSPAPLTKTYLKEVPTDIDTPYCYIAVTNSTTNNTDCNNGTRCNFYYLAVKLNQSENEQLPEALQSLCPDANYVVTP